MEHLERLRDSAPMQRRQELGPSGRYCGRYCPRRAPVTLSLSTSEAPSDVLANKWGS